MVLVISLSALLLLSAMLPAWMTLAVVEQRIAQNHYTHTQARATAESGLEQAIYRASNGQAASAFDLTLPDQGVAHVVVTEVDATHRTVDSRAEHAGASSRVRATIQQRANGGWDLVPGTYTEPGSGS